MSALITQMAQGIWSSLLQLPRQEACTVSDKNIVRGFTTTKRISTLRLKFQRCRSYAETNAMASSYHTVRENIGDLNGGPVVLWWGWVTRKKRRQECGCTVMQDGSLDPSSREAGECRSRSPSVNNATSNDSRELCVYSDAGVLLKLYNKLWRIIYGAYGLIQSTRLCETEEL